MADTRLYNVYMISGGCKRTPKGVEVIEKTAVPIRHAFFSRLNHKEHSIITTDEYGMLGSIGNGGNKLARINDQCLGPMSLVPIPPGIARYSYFVNDKEWQNKLVQSIQEMNPQAMLEPVPVTFTDKHLRPGTDKEENEMLKHFQGRTCKGQLIPRFHTLAVVLDQRFVAKPPGTLTAHNLKTKEAVKLQRSPKIATLDAPPSGWQAWVYSATGDGIQEADYVVEIDHDAIATGWRHEGGRTFRRTFHVSFGIHTLFGDYDFQLLDLPSVESALLTHFAERYPHLIMEEAATDKPKKQAFEQAENALAQYRHTYDFWAEKKKMAVGFVNADASEKAKTIIEKSLDGIRDAKIEGVSDAAEIAAKIYAKAYASKDMAKKWQALVSKMHIGPDNAKALGLVQHLMSEQNIPEFFKRPTEWRRIAIDAIHSSQQGEKNLLGRYLLFRKENADPAVLKKLMLNAASPKLEKFESVFDEVKKAKATMGKWALDSVNTLKSACETITALNDLFAAEDKADGYLRDAIAEYKTKFRYQARGGEKAFAPCTEVVPKLEVLRKVADTASLETDKKIIEAAKQAAQLTIDAIGLVPAFKPFTEVINQVGASLSTLGSVVDVASEAIDRFVFRHRGSIHRFTELAQLHMLQVRAIDYAQRDGKLKSDDPYIQFRLRLVILIGLLRLIERCGPRDELMAERAKANNVDGYIEHYIFAQDAYPIALSSGTPLDDIWIYGCIRKNCGWKDIEARVRSISDSVSDLLRNTKTVFTRVAFQKHFPISGKSSRGGLELVRAFCLDFSKVIDHDLVYSRIYVRKNPKDRWVSVEKANFPIEPSTPVRVAAVFKNEKENLAGVPMSLQLVRVDQAWNTDGPEYKTGMTHAWQSSESDDGFADKGLLPYIDDEKKYIGKDGYYACVFYPFYYFQKHMVHGIKPMGHIGLSGDPTFDVSFSLKAGEDSRYVDASKSAEEARIEGKSAAFYPIMGQIVGVKASLDEARGRTVRVHMPTSNRAYVDMILNKEFLEHKDSNPHWENMFDHHKQHYQVGCVYWRGKEGVWRYSGVEKGRFVNRLGPSQFAWGQPFEILVVFASTFASQQKWPGDPIKVPGYMDVRDIPISGGDGVQGPAYPVEVVSLRRDEVFRGTVDAMTLQAGLHAAQVLGKNEPFVPAGFGLAEAGVLWAVRAKFEFQIQGPDADGKPGLMQAQTGMRPFGKVLMDRTGGYIYRFSLSAPGNIGLHLPNVAEFTVPGIPEDAFPNTFMDGTQKKDGGAARLDQGNAEDSQAKWKWVTDEKLRTSLEVKRPL